MEKKSYSDGKNMDKVGSNFNLENLREGTKSLSNLSKNLGNNIVKKYQETSTDVLNTIKETKLRNLEYMLRIDKTERVYKKKRVCIYISASKIIIIERDMWGEPSLVTVKEGNSVNLKKVKYLDDSPFIYPYFDEKNIFGNIINLEEDEIWYNDSGDVVILKFFGSNMSTVRIKADISKKFTHEDLDRNPDLKLYVKNCSYAYRDSNLKTFLDSRNIKISDVIRIGARFLVHKTFDRNYQVIILRDNYNIKEVFKLRKLPFTGEASLNTLFSDEIVSYVKEHNYKFEDFSQTGNFIEYWKYLGDQKVCLLRCKINEH